MNILRIDRVLVFLYFKFWLLFNSSPISEIMSHSIKDLAKVVNNISSMEDLIEFQKKRNKPDQLAIKYQRPKSSAKFYLPSFSNISKLYTQTYSKYMDSISVSDNLRKLPAIEMDSLHDIYVYTNGVSWSNWNFSGPSIYSNNPCSQNWTSIGCRCNNMIGVCHIASLNFTNANLQGSIPQSIGNLTNLEILIFDQNYQIYGSIPDSIGELIYLKTLIIKETFFYGSVPSTIGKLQSLKVLAFVQDYLLGGEIPSIIGNLISLDTLYFYGTSFSGTIPNTICNLTSLQTLFIYENSQLVGTIPNDFGNMKRLTELQINYNPHITGTLPSSFGSLTNLQNLLILATGIYGPIPSELGNLKNVVLMALDGNQFTGTIPSELGMMTSIKTLEIFQNKLSGSIPSELSNLLNIEQLSLGYDQNPSSEGNHFEGKIPSELCTLPKLSLLEMPANDSTCYPSCLHKVLSTIYLSNRPHCQGFDDLALCNLTFSSNVYEVISVSSSKVITIVESTHPLPDSYNFYQQVLVPFAEEYTIDFVTALLPSPYNNLTLCMTDFCGKPCNDQGYCVTPITVPATPLGITVTYIGPFNGVNPWGFSIKITASVPYYGWECSKPSQLLAHSSAYLDIPSYVVGLCESNTRQWYGISCGSGFVTDINLNALNLKGSIPELIFVMPKIEYLSLGYNNFLGYIPNKISPTFRYLDLSANQLKLALPNTLGDLKKLSTLNLYDNKLTGSVPRSLSNLSNTLQSLDLSANLLEGEIPSSFCSLVNTTVSLVNNLLITCYQPCSGNITSPLIDELPMCVPTQTPTLIPSYLRTNPPIQSSSIGTTTIIIISCISGAALIGFVVFIIWFYKKQEKYKYLKLEEKSRKRREISRRNRLVELPIHHLICNNKSVRCEELITVIDENKDTLYELDYDDKSLFDLALENSVSDSVIAELIKHFLPCFENENGIVCNVDSQQHHYAWIKMIGPTDKYASVVQSTLNSYPKLCFALANSTDESGRTAVEVMNTYIIV